MATLNKLSTAQVYDKIRPIMCSIHTPLGESSGFFLEDGSVVTVAHNVIFNQPYFAQINYRNPQGITPIFPKKFKEMNLENAKALDLCAFETNVRVQESLSFLPETVKLYEGMKVYFAGFPLGSDAITFHKGVISSISHEQELEEFTVDGTVVPGSSGGPVVAVHEGSLYLVGVITSEMADFRTEDLKTIAIMKQLKQFHQNIEKKILLEREKNPDQKGSVLNSTLGFGTPIEISTPEGKESLIIFDRSVIHLELDLFERNLSTGIGRAVDIREYKHLISQNVIKRTEGPYFFPTKGKKLIQGSISFEQSKQEVLKYIEIRFGIGKGPRGIQFVLNNGGGMHRYKFSPNPHTASGNYNKNQEELYSAAALVFAESVSNSSIPQAFSFIACQGNYAADKID